MYKTKKRKMFDYCRVCLKRKEEDELTCLFEDAIVGVSLPIEDVITSICNVTIQTGDGKPQFICDQCMENARIAYNFKATCEKADKRLQSIDFNSLLSKGVDDLNVDESVVKPIEIRKGNINGYKCIAKRNKKPEQSINYIVVNSTPVEDIVKQEEDNFSDVEILIGEEGDEEEDEDASVPTEQKNTLKQPQSTAQTVELTLKKCTKENCGFRPKDQAQYDRHMVMHEAETRCKGTQKCPTCQKYFLRPSNLIKHWITVHGLVKESPSRDKRVNVCEICGLVTSDRGNLQKHINIHTMKRKFECKYCDKVYAQSAALFCHVRVNHGSKDFVCEECGAAFVLRTRLMNHMRLHKNAREFHCNRCEKRFNTPEQLRSHRRSVHEGIRPHACEVCHKQFSKSYTLKTHMRIHTQEKPYQCNFCDQAFSQNVSLRLHLKKHSNVSQMK